MELRKGTGNMENTKDLLDRENHLYALCLNPDETLSQTLQWRPVAYIMFMHVCMYVRMLYGTDT